MCGHTSPGTSRTVTASLFRNFLAIDDSTAEDDFASLTGIACPLLDAVLNGNPVVLSQVLDQLEFVA